LNEPKRGRPAYRRKKGLGDRLNQTTRGEKGFFTGPVACASLIKWVPTKEVAERQGTPDRKRKIYRKVICIGRARKTKGVYFKRKRFDKRSRGGRKRNVLTT